MTAPSNYQIRFVDSGETHLPAGKVVCVGRNYAEHAKELNNPVPKEPLLFIKTTTSLVPLEEPLSIPGNQGECHFETEVALLIGERISHCTPEQGIAAISGVGIALDLTLRDLQTKLKEKGQPWEKAKAFDGACPMSAFIPASGVADLSQLCFQLSLNGRVVQQGCTSDMIFSIPDLLVYISRFFTLMPGDIVLTGTPAGVGPLSKGDQLIAELDGHLAVETHVADADKEIG